MRQLPTVISFLAAIVGLGISTANAQFYAGAHGGANFLQDSDIDGGGVEAEASFDPGFAVGGVLGYRVGLGAGLSLDAEGEFTYRLNDIDEVSAAGFPREAGGETQSFAWMANAWVNWQIGESGFAPYLGGGFGGVHIDIKDAQVAGISLGNESDFVIAGQLGGGLGYHLAEHVAVSLDYRFLITEGTKFQGLDVTYRSHSVLLGIKYLF